MSNMSYCRFENTYRDLCDCRDALSDLYDEKEDTRPLSQTELEYAKDLVEVCREIIEMTTNSGVAEQNHRVEELRKESE